MSKSRMEAFSDGVIAIILTLMILELKIPQRPDIAALLPVVPFLLIYALSFIFLGIYWNNHHHLLQAVKHVDGRILWANLHLLFWLSLIPFVTGWVGENGVTQWPVAMYGVVMLFSGFAYFVLVRLLIALHGGDSLLALAVGNDVKGKISLIAYLCAIGLAFLNPWISCAIYIGVAGMWLSPEKRIERTILH